MDRGDAVTLIQAIQAPPTSPDRPQPVPAHDLGKHGVKHPPGSSGILVVEDPHRSSFTSSPKCQRGFEEKSFCVAKEHLQVLDQEALGDWRSSSVVLVSIVTYANEHGALVPVHPKPVDTSPNVLIQRQRQQRSRGPVSL